jgi:hypothetical protein
MTGIMPGFGARSLRILANNDDLLFISIDVEFCSE